MDLSLVQIINFVDNFPLDKRNAILVYDILEIFRYCLVFLKCLMICMENILQKEEKTKPGALATNLKIVEGPGPIEVNALMLAV